MIKNILFISGEIFWITKLIAFDIEARHPGAAIRIMTLVHLQEAGENFSHPTTYLVSWRCLAETDVKDIDLLVCGPSFSRDSKMTLLPFHLPHKRMEIYSKTMPGSYYQRGSMQPSLQVFRKICSVRPFGPLGKYRYLFSEGAYLALLPFRVALRVTPFFMIGTVLTLLFRPLVKIPWYNKRLLGWTCHSPAIGMMKCCDLAVAQEIQKRGFLHEPLLDAAAGEGRWAEILFKNQLKAGKKIEAASDPIAPAIELARQKNIYNELRIEKFEDSSFPDSSFATIYSNNGILNCFDLGEAIREAARTLRPGGTLVFNVYGRELLNGRGYLRRKFYGLLGMDQARQRLEKRILQDRPNWWTPEEMRGLLEEHGLEMQECYGYISGLNFWIRKFLIWSTYSYDFKISGAWFWTKMPSESIKKLLYRYVQWISETLFPLLSRYELSRTDHTCGIKYYIVAQKRSSV